MLISAEEKKFKDGLKSKLKETQEKDLRYIHGYREAVFLPLPN